MNYFIYNQKGNVTLMSVLFIMVLGVIIVTAISMISLNSSMNSMITVKKAQANELANACLEKALYDFYTTKIINGTQTYIFDEGNCIYDFKKVDNVLEMKITGKTKYSTKNYLVNLSLSPNIEIISLEEVSKF